MIIFNFDDTNDLTEDEQQFLYKEHYADISKQNKDLLELLFIFYGFNEGREYNKVELIEELNIIGYNDKIEIIKKQFINILNEIDDDIININNLYFYHYYNDINGIQQKLKIMLKFIVNFYKYE